MKMRGNRGVDADVDVVVVGAGIAGLTVATLLSQRGKSVRCLEARDRIGGGPHTVFDSGLAIDMGASWFWRCHRRWRSQLLSSRPISLTKFSKRLARHRCGWVKP